jgi:phosphopantetheinyl transferase (holo-ACP synthase)
MIDRGPALAGEAHEDWSHLFALPFEPVVCFVPLGARHAADSRAVDAYLSEAERHQWRRLSERALPKRQAEWLSGRLAAKAAVQRYWRSSRDELLPPMAISIEPDALGKPVVSLSGQSAAPAISISHTRNALLALACEAGRSVGIDLEPLDRVLKDERAFVRLTLGEGERALFEGLPPADDRLLHFWVAKEAAAKAAGTGFQGKPKGFEIRSLAPGEQASVVHEGREYAVRFRLRSGYLCAVAYAA